jgi:hypothetical protein
MLDESNAFARITRSLKRAVERVYPAAASALQTSRMRDAFDVAWERARDQTI